MTPLLGRRTITPTDNTYRTAAKPSSEVETTSQDIKSGVNKDVTVAPTTVQVPFSEYEKKNGKPYPVDYFDLGRFWNTGDIYTKEVETINTYIDHLVATGELNNTIDSVKSKLKSIEKMINIAPDDRRAARVGKVAAYMEFLIKSDNIKKDSAKYGMI